MLFARYLDKLEVPHVANSNDFLFPTDLNHLKVFLRLDFHPPNPLVGMSYSDVYKLSTGTYPWDPFGSDLFPNMNLHLDQHAHEDDEGLEEFDFSVRF